MKHAGYIIQDLEGYAIYGIGQTVDEAWEEVKSAINFLDFEGNEVADDVAYHTQFKVFGATQALLDKVKAEGGAISWDIVKGLACTHEETENINHE